MCLLNKTPQTDVPMPNRCRMSTQYHHTINQMKLLTKIYEAQKQLNFIAKLKSQQLVVITHLQQFFQSYM